MNKHVVAAEYTTISWNSFPQHIYIYIAVFMLLYIFLFSLLLDSSNFKCVICEHLKILSWTFGICRGTVLPFLLFLVGKVLLGLIIFDIIRGYNSIIIYIVFGLINA